MHISRINLSNFKRFDNFTFHARPGNLLVGPNNSGKSSILDALRILHSCLRYARSRSPSLIAIEGSVFAGYNVPAASIEVPLQNIGHNYSAESTQVSFLLSSREQLSIVLEAAAPAVMYLEREVNQPRTAHAFQAAAGIDLLIVPDLSPFEAEERQVTDETVRRNRTTRLAARTFRNIWRRSSEEEFEEFRALVEASWPGVSIKRPEWVGFEAPVTMFYSEQRRDREVFWSGYGFQVWLQILTHMLRSQDNTILVMDEPDIYLHADLQKRLMRLIERKFSQYFLATHSAEIINEAETGSVASINPARNRAKRIISDEDFQAVYNYIGSSENAELAKLVRARRIIFFEGEDKRLVRKFAVKLGFNAIARDTEALIIAAGGFSRWRRVADADWALREVLQIEAKMFALFDRDYRCASELGEVQRELRGRDILCHVWGRKEIENYLLTESSLIRLLTKKSRQHRRELSLQESAALLGELTLSYFEYVSERVLDHVDRGWAGCPGREEEREAAYVMLSEAWLTIDGRFRYLPGKKFIGELSAYTKLQYGFSLTPQMLLDELRPAEVPDDMGQVLSALDEFCRDEVAATLEAMPHR